MSTPSEEPEEQVAEQEPGQESSSSYPPPPPGGGVQVRGTVRVSERPQPASDGALELEDDDLEDDAPELAVAEATEEDSLEIDVAEMEEAEEIANAQAATSAGGSEDSAAGQAEQEAEPASDVATEAEAAPAEPDGPEDAPAEPEAIEAEPEAAASDAAEGEEEAAAKGEPADADDEGDAEPAEDLEIEEVEEEDPDALELKEVAEEDEAVDDGRSPPPVPPEPDAAAGPSGGPPEAGPKEAPPEPPKRKRKRPWFETFFNDDYLRTVPPPTEKEVARQVDFIEQQLGLERGATILDVGCGLGMHAVELAARGYLVVGLDLSLPMLSRAGDEAQDRGLKINFLHGDMREMAFDGSFDAVVCWGTTFGYFDDDANRKVIERLYKALKPKGLLLLDVVNRDFVIPKQPNLIWFEGDGCVCMEETSFNYITSRLEVKRTVILDDGRQRETRYSIRMYSLHELGQLLHVKDFRVAQISGAEATSGVFFGGDSPRLIILAERRARPSSPPSGEMPMPPGANASIPPPPPTPPEAKEAPPPEPEDSSEPEPDES